MNIGKSNSNALKVISGIEITLWARL
ncbi:hypothetical protein Goari_026946 [Gossypium aridum]|uniref:Uncharacterized protein n=1 Tax=Gossypium aridum TaxID=34290 RepID=A0A7J8YPD5_GOSAI|nr:hypothetical protein [Gossypium aridum]